eukprot:TRINITY_DN1082_c0_g1::TRINITY_DN1082_c0_g1_i1::g.29975::m.29975 TRINITY_DN1082_c0_g1::TRINITY_DN1082_c0_g1_i1::g.29975  ORF type:complete len:261 (+),score=43.37,sp/Q9DD20/MET7B_MOUSE/34.01/4e-19,Methyltransf_11/PF08241.7/3e-19,Methyltransf_23/PF13489.1/1.1e-14,Ubie_methyltran/PF01209.13/1.9e-11,Methyltransf_31/PF13847.1/9.9e-10,Methyltransf_12/PF08242.7/3.2e-08,Methyltransf_12/PF08242.7/8.8e+03,Methyltransf_25/PF13649.1/3.7e-07,Methyltransf_29/PF03141.11/6.3e-06,Methyltransf_18/PF12847.2/2.6e-0
MILKLVTFLVLGTAVGLGSFLQVLKHNDGLRNRFFANCCHTMTKGDQEWRCNYVKNAKGQVLELGPGTGVNFQCYNQTQEIKSWVGVEPNQYMHGFLYQAAYESNLTFPIELAQLAGERLPYEDQSFDTVVSTHVLCSVTDQAQVLNEVARVLRPGGQFIFLEHVLAPHGSMLEKVQLAIEALGWPIFANGCRFMATSEIIDQYHEEFEIKYDSFDLEKIPLPIARPHIAGRAVRTSAPLSDHRAQSQPHSHSHAHDHTH